MYHEIDQLVVIHWVGFSFGQAREHTSRMVSLPAPAVRLLVPQKSRGGEGVHESVSGLLAKLVMVRKYLGVPFAGVVEVFSDGQQWKYDMIICLACNTT